MSEGDSTFSPTRIEMLRNTWKVLEDSKDLAEAKTKFKQLILNLVLGREE